jgi:F-type H+-transporting ATPase subunit b
MFEFHWQNMLSQVITFLIAVVIVWKFGWKSILQMIRDRQEKIKKTLDDAENARAAITKLEADYRAKLEQVESRSNELIAIARQDASRAKDEMLKAAEAEAAQMRKKSHEQLEADQRRLMGEIRSEVITLAMAVAEKTLGQSLPGAVHEQKFKQMLDELSKTPRRAS